MMSHSLFRGEGRESVLHEEHQIAVTDADDDYHLLNNPLES